MQVRDGKVCVHYETHLIELGGHRCLLLAFQLQGSAEIYIGQQSFGPPKPKERNGER